MGRKLYFECAAGISGDMSVAAMIDLGADTDVLDRALKSLDIGHFETKISRVSKNGIDVCDFNVITEIDNHDHDMEYLHGHLRGHDHEHTHADGHTHTHEHIHGGHHHHEHCGLKEITEIINHADLTEGARARAHKIFLILAQAEAKAHATDIENVHFHEVGAVDSIVDIVAFAVCMDNIGIDEVIIPALTDGKGFIRCQHGIIPVPVPAVMNIAEAEGLNLRIQDIEGELVTPTGAAIAAAVKTSDKLPERFSVIKYGMGAGKRNYEIPGILRVMIIETNAESAVYKLETNIDDCTGEALGYTMEKLLAAGARDVYYTPAYMKKNRPAYVLNVICSEKDIEECERIIFLNTTTIGIRRIKIERTALDRKLETVNTSLGEIKVKRCTIADAVRIYPEYESVRELCEKLGMPYTDVYGKILGELNKEVKKRA